MAVWSCGHPRKDTEWSSFNDPTGSVLSFWAVYAATAEARVQIAQELRQRGQQCPACRNQSRRLRRGWGALAVVAALLLLVAWRIH